MSEPIINRDLSAKNKKRDDRIAALEAENAKLREVVDSIAQMCRAKMQRSLECQLTVAEYYEEFVQWAQSICRHALTPPTEEWR